MHQAHGRKGESKPEAGIWWSSNNTLAAKCHLLCQLQLVIVLENKHAGAIDFTHNICIVHRLQKGMRLFIALLFTKVWPLHFRSYGSYSLPVHNSDNG